MGLIFMEVTSAHCSAFIVFISFKGSGGSNVALGWLCVKCVFVYSLLLLDVSLL